MGWEGGLIQLFTAWARSALAAGVMALSIPAITFAQATEPATESSPEIPTGAVDNALPIQDTTRPEDDTSVETGPGARASIPTKAEVEIQHHFNGLRSELLDDREKLVDWWLTATAIFLTLLGIVAVIAGYLSFERFREIEAKCARM